MEEERKNHNILLTVIGVTTLLVAMVGATFAYFSATSKSTEQNIKTGELKVVATSDKLNAENIKPTTLKDDTDNDELSSNKDVAAVKLTVKTEGTTIEGATYNIFLDATGIKLNTEGRDGDNQLLKGGQLSDVKWALFDEDKDNLLGSGDFSEVSATDEGIVTDFKVNNTVENIEITPNEESPHIYKLYIWIQDDENEQNQLQGLTIGATLNVKAKQGL